MYRVEQVSAKGAVKHFVQKRNVGVSQSRAAAMLPAEGQLLGLIGRDIVVGDERLGNVFPNPSRRS